MNQFAKISPLVTSNGEILKIDNNGEYTIHSGIYLKQNEMGICIEDNSIVCIINKNGELVPSKMKGIKFSTKEQIINYASENNNGDMNGEIISCESSPCEVYTVVGTNLYNITENNTKNIIVEFNTGENYQNGIVISNSDIRNSSNVNSGVYRINNVTITTGLIPYKANINGSLTTIDPVIQIISGNVNDKFFISEKELGKSNLFISDLEFTGNLTVKLLASTFANQSGVEIPSFSVGNKITVNINYTPIK